MASMTIPQALRAALQHHQAGRLHEARQLYQAILQHDPRHVEALHLCGVAAHQSGDNPAAVDLIQRAIAVDPSRGDFRSDLGLILTVLGKCSQAVAVLEEGSRHFPNHPEMHCNLGYALCENRQYEQSVAASRRALEIRPGYAEAYVNLGTALAILNRPDEAIEAFQNAAKHRPGFAEALANLGNLLNQQGRHAEALAACREAIAGNPNWISAYVVAGTALRDMGRLPEALEHFKKAMAMNPTSAEACNNLSSALRDMNQLDDAMAACVRSIQLRPIYAAPHNNLAGSLMDAGRLDEAIEQYDAALKLEPAAAHIQSNRVYAMNFSARHCDLAAMQAEQQRWNQIHAAPLEREIRGHANDRDPDRKLRLGFVSPDFCDHCQSFFTIPLLGNLDREQYETFCYASVPKVDAISDRVRGHADHWRRIAQLSDADAAELIRQDRIDVLVDLTQHMAGNRLPIFARKPAPVQVAWLGYPGSTGLKAIDYRLSDPHLDPPGAFERFYSEATLRLPDTFWCYDSLETGVQVNPLPAIANGHITFGCLNNFCKINNGVLQLFAAVMREVPRSRLLLLAKFGSHRQAAIARLGQLGIEAGRVEFLDRCTRRQYLEAYHRIDLSLDTLPYNGHTTSLDSFWMGVPVVTCIGQTPVGRAGLSLCMNLNLPELVAETDGQYISIVKSLCEDQPRLAALRDGLRTRMEASPLMDAPRFARGFESAIRYGWRRWCAGEVPVGR